MSNTPHSSQLSRGSALADTSQIPETDIPVSPVHSFLSRFLGRSISNPSSPPIPATSSTPHETTNPKASTNAPQQVPADEVTSAVASIHLDQENNLDPDVSPQTSSSLPHQNEDEITPNGTNQTPAEQKLPPAKTLEQVADEAEDTLIQVKPDTDSLLFEGRPSHPILRFSAGNALIDHNALDKTGLPLGFVWSPFGDLREVHRIPKAPYRCGTCGSFVAKGNGAEGLLAGSSRWTCAFCGRNDNDVGDTPPEKLKDSTSYPQLFSDTVQYEQPQQPPTPINRRGAIILIIDENLEEEEADWARTAVAAVHVAAAERGLRFALLTIGSGCSVAVRRDDDTSAASFEMLSAARASKLTTTEKERFFLNPPASVVSGTAYANGTYEELEKAPTDPFITPRAASAFVAERDGATAEKKDGEEGQPRRRVVRLPADAESRRLDVAIVVAFELIKDIADSESTRILSLITGPPTLAEHALRTSSPRPLSGTAPDEAKLESSESFVALSKLYEQVGSKAGDMRIALDFLCFGAEDGFAGEILLGAAKRSRGGLLYSATHTFSSAPALAEAAVFLVQRSTNPGVVSIRVSSPLSVARVIGPAFPTASQHTYAVPGVDPITGFCVVLKSQIAPEADADVLSHAVVQLAAKAGNITRVVTVRIPLTKNVHEYMNSLDAEICALILGKACIVSGGALTRPSISRQAVDLTVQRLLLGSEKATGVARLLFELRRGLLLGQHVHGDISLVLRSFFLRSDVSLASLLMSPRLFTNAMADDATGLMAEVQLEKMYVTDEAVLVLDTGFNVFVYVGPRASKESEDAISQSARAVAAKRISPCQLWKLTPGPDAEYLLETYLSPSSESKSRRRLDALEQGFIAYCTSLARGSKSVKALKQAQASST
ncbi:hypothetical protein BWQ96_01880 [Gracilariopsis chorda]|uniref:Protein transport protein SEC23 n=1 Tax=Gracilariopsis chorda TaxID=448386 RepID=A0A2V3J4W7_9FLOR|nr:hypothetical protein BWQ96_01880 [Gracilariopsis chorda]|eukprot:PXF48420.1 hypothetical protein BWQ96_01880 [Gracilariopsis chorda]